jgi:hypothetical protein
MLAKPLVGGRHSSVRSRGRRREEEEEEEEEEGEGRETKIRGQATCCFSQLYQHFLGFFNSRTFLQPLRLEYFYQDFSGLLATPMIF